MLIFLRKQYCCSCLHSVITGGTVSTHKGCNIPSGNISMNVVTEKDEKDLAFIAKLDPEYVAASFIGKIPLYEIDRDSFFPLVRRYYKREYANHISFHIQGTASDVQRVRDCLTKNGNTNIKVCTLTIQVQRNV